ncbi:gp53-like domain-containing protein [Azospirillum aestuarii]|uniref:gp53-like domain-containing protein n=1 Tax=Azospirillum aestuarii TaxID=2802052 RepID=UPI004054DFBB
MLYDRVEQTTITTGTGTLSLIAPTDASRRSFVQAAGSGGRVWYCIETIDGTQYEYGIGTCTAGTPDILTRTTVMFSSNANALVNFPAGTKRVFCTLPARAASFRGALLRRTLASGNDFADNNVASTAIWSGTDYDTDGFWSGSSRITVPSGLGIRRVRLSAQVGLPAAITATGYLIIRRGGATFPEPRCPAPAGTQTLWASTPPLQVSDGDYFEVLVQQTSGAARPFSTAWDLHWFSIEEVK